MNFLEQPEFRRIFTVLTPERIVSELRSPTTTERPIECHGINKPSSFKLQQILLRGVKILLGKNTVKAALSADRTVEIQLFDSGEAEARYYFKGKLMRKCRQATHDKICIMGGTRESEEAWFVAVSRERPD